MGAPGEAAQPAAAATQEEPRGAVGQGVDRMVAAGKDALAGSALTLPVRTAAGMVEAGANMASGMVGSAVGGLHGIYDVVTGKGADQATKDIQADQEALTYQPRTAVGKMT